MSFPTSATATATATRTIADFAEQIPCYEIWYYISDTDGKKTPVYEKNNIKLEEVEDHKRKNATKARPRTKPVKNKNGTTDYVPLSDAESASLVKAYSLLMKYWTDAYCVDIDDPTVLCLDDFIQKTGYTMFEGCTWIPGNTKGIHIYVKINNMVEFTNQQDVYSNFHGDLIKKNNMWERVEKPVHNYNGSVKTFDYEDIKHIFNGSLNKGSIKKVKSKDNAEAKPPSIEEPTPEINVSPTNMEENNIQKNRELFALIKIKDVKDRNGWQKLCACMKHNGLTNADWVNFGFKNSLNMDEEKLEFYHNLTPYQININHAENLAKETNPTEYKKWFQKWNAKEHSSNAEGFRIATNDDDASDMLFDDLKHILKSYQGRLFYRHENIWIGEKPVIDNYVLKLILKSGIYSGVNEKTNKPTPFAQNMTRAKQIRDALYCKIITENEDVELYQKFHRTMTDKLCFMDGVLNLKDKTFTLWKDIAENSIYPIVQIKRDYKNHFENPNVELANDIRDKIFNTQYGDKAATALKFLSRAIAGQYEDKRWATYLGNRNCGKGVEYDLLKTAFGDYVATFEVGNMLYSRKTAGQENVDCSRKLYWLIDLEFVRLAISQEIPDSTSEQYVNSKILKKITGGGDEIIGKRNYDRVDTHFTLDTTFYIKGNSSLTTDSEDCNETRLEFNSVMQFKSEAEIALIRQRVPTPSETEMQRYRVKDNTIKDKCKTEAWANAMVYLIMQNYCNAAVEIEKTVNDEDNSLLTAINNKFKYADTKDGKIPKILVSDVYESLPGRDKGKIALELAAMNIFKKKETSGKNKGKYCFVNIVEIEVEDEEAETTATTSA